MSVQTVTYFHGLDGTTIDGWDAFDIVPEMSVKGAPTTSLAALVWASLFTDAHDPDTDAGGFWADTYESESVGSRVWTYQSEPLSAETIEGVREAAQEALSWLVDTGICGAVAVAVRRSKQNRTRLELAVRLTRPSQKQAFAFQALWDEVS